MDAAQTRRSDRVSLEVPIQISGTDEAGRVFMDDTKALQLSRHGAKILLGRKLVPDQEIMIRCLENSLEAETRVVGLIREESEGYSYGVEFLDPDANLWNIEFPPMSESERGVARIVLECACCRSRELVYLNELEAEVFESNKTLSRHCKRCTGMTLWKEARGPLPGDSAPPRSQAVPRPIESSPRPETPAAASPKPPAVAPPKEPAVAPQATPTERRKSGVRLNLTACIRHAHLGEEVVVTENISREGLGFKSSKHYAEGWSVEVAVPYSVGAGNIFVQGRVTRLEAVPAEGLTLYGVSYVRAHKG